MKNTLPAKQRCCKTSEIHPDFTSNLRLIPPGKKNFASPEKYVKTTALQNHIGYYFYHFC